MEGIVFDINCPLIGGEFDKREVIAFWNYFKNVNDGVFFKRGFFKKTISHSNFNLNILQKFDLHR